MTKLPAAIAVSLKLATAELEYTKELELSITEPVFTVIMNTAV